MFARTIKQCCEITESRIQGDVPTGLVIHDVTIDSRQADEETLFFALAGSRTHGIEFADEASQRGAVVVTDEQTAVRSDGPLLVVEDPQLALHQLALSNRRQSDALVIGITGSVGKTTTRRLMTSVLSSVHTGIQSPANYNNELGVPLSILDIEDHVEFASIELGARQPGDLRFLCQIAEPEFAVVTRVAPSHLASFESIDEIMATKRELVEALKSDGTVFLNADDPRVASMNKSTQARVVTFGQAKGANLRYRLTGGSNTQLMVRVGSTDYRVPVCGAHHADAIGASLAVAMELGLSPGDIQAGFDQFQAAPGRTALQKVNGIEVIDDTYNANPASVQAAIRLLSDWKTGGHRVLVLGDMLDLGDRADELHYAMGILMARADIDHSVAYGRHANDVADGFVSAGGSLSRISVFDDEATLLAVLECLVVPGDTLLIKGSRGMAMERTIAGLRVSRPELRRAA
jgi:UDP-N-acetylmuramoyl-tripeptide--D-alanyl-D-alanine ligase